MWRDAEGDLLALCPLPNAAQMRQEDWTILFDELRSAQTHITALLKLKTVFWKQLPWVLVGVAHTDTNIARAAGRSAIEQFNKDPRKEVHHRLTWVWLEPGTHLRKCLEEFVDGEQVVEVGVEFARAVARLRFVIVVESTMESRHARVTVSRRSHAIGPVRVSLANRLGLLDSRAHKQSQADTKFIH